MGEGWSDFFALALTHGTAGDDPLAQYSIAPYVSYKWYSTGTTPINFLENYVYGIRRFPVTVDNSVNPLTWADADPFTADLSGGISPSPQNIQVAVQIEVIRRSRERRDPQSAHPR